MTTRVGNLTVVSEATLLLPHGDDGFVDFKLGGWHVKVQVVLVETEDGELGLSLETRGDTARLQLTNWKNSLGSATRSPIEVGLTSEGSPLLLMVLHNKVGEVDHLHLQFLMEIRS